MSRSLWLMLGLSALLLIAVAAQNFAYTNSYEPREAYIRSRNWVSSDVLQKVSLVYFAPSPKCDANTQDLVRSIAEILGAEIAASLPKDRIVLVITLACGLTQSTFYRKPASFEMWISYCDPASGPVCLAQTVLAFTHILRSDGDLVCAQELVRQELLDSSRRDVRRSLRESCDVSSNKPGRKP